MASRPAPLYRRVLGWLLTYLALISLAVFSVGNYVHEHAEHAAWRALLNSELDSIVEHTEHEPHYRWQDSDTLSLFRFNEAYMPASLRTLHPGLHDGVMIGERETAVMVRDTGSMGRVALALDISDFHDLEQFATRWVMLAGAMKRPAGLPWAPHRQVVRRWPSSCRCRRGARWSCSLARCIRCPPSRASPSRPRAGWRPCPPSSRRRCPKRRSSRRCRRCVAPGTYLPERLARCPPLSRRGRLLV